MSASYLTPDEWDRIFENLADPYKTIMIFCRYTACRRGTALGLKISDVYESDGTPKKRITFPNEIVKGKNRGYSVDVCESLRKSLAVYKHDRNGWLFPSPRKNGKALSARSLEYVLNKLNKKIWLRGKKLTSHSARISTLTDLAKKGIRWEVIRKISNHKNIQTLVNHYLIVNEQDTKDALNLL